MSLYGRGRYGLPASYDNWRMHGYSHKCACGATYYDSDGGPCHSECQECGTLTSVEDLEDGYCEECIPMECAGGCGEEFPKTSDDWLYEDVCDACAALLVDIVEAELEDVLSLAEPGDENLIDLAVKARLAGEALPEKATKAVEAWRARDAKKKEEAHG